MKLVESRSNVNVFGNKSVIVLATFLNFTMLLFSFPILTSIINVLDSAIYQTKQLVNVLKPPIRASQ